MDPSNPKGLMAMREHSERFLIAIFGGPWGRLIAQERSE